MPQIQTQPGLTRMNGLYRHGFLISPKLVELAVQTLVCA
jgi:glycine oxidase